MGVSVCAATVATTVEVVQDTTFIIGTILVQLAFALVVFDSDSKHTFLAKAFVDKTDMKLDDLSYNIVMSTPVGVVLTMEVCVRAIIVMI